MIIDPNRVDSVVSMSIYTEAGTAVPGETQFSTRRSLISSKTRKTSEPVSPAHAASPDIPGLHSNLGFGSSTLSQALLKLVKLWFDALHFHALIYSPLAVHRVVPHTHTWWHFNLHRGNWEHAPPSLGPRHQGSTGFRSLVLFQKEHAHTISLVVVAYAHAAGANTRFLYKSLPSASSVYCSTHCCISAFLVTTIFQSHHHEVLDWCYTLWPGRGLGHASHPASYGPSGCSWKVV